MKNELRGLLRDLGFIKWRGNWFLRHKERAGMARRCDKKIMMKLQGTEKPIAVNIRIIVEAAQTLKTLNHDESRNRVELAHVARIIRQAADEINTMAKVRAERRLQDLTVTRP